MPHNAQWALWGQVERELYQVESVLSAGMHPPRRAANWTRHASSEFVRNPKFMPHFVAYIREAPFETTIVIE